MLIKKFSCQSNNGKNDAGIRDFRSATTLKAIQVIFHTRLQWSHPPLPPSLLAEKWNYETVTLSHPVTLISVHFVSLSKIKSPRHRRSTNFEFKRSSGVGVRIGSGGWRKFNFRWTLLKIIIIFSSFVISQMWRKWEASSGIGSITVERTVCEWRKLCMRFYDDDSNLCAALINSKRKLKGKHTSMAQKVVRAPRHSAYFYQQKREKNSRRSANSKFLLK